MKKVLFLLMVVALSSCGTLPHYSENSYLLDFKQYTGEDFTINPSSVSNGEFEPLGIIEECFYFGNKVDAAYKDNVQESKDAINSMIKWYTPKMEWVFKKAIDSAKSIGANGIVEFDLSKTYHANGRVNGYKVTGVAVKFK